MILFFRPGSWTCISSFLYGLIVLRDGSITVIDAYNWSSVQYIIPQVTTNPNSLISAWAPGRRLLTCSAHSLELKRLHQIERQEQSIIANVGKEGVSKYTYENVANMVSNQMREHLTLKNLTISSQAEYVAMIMYIEDSIEPGDTIHPLVEVYKCLDPETFTLVQHW